MDEALTLGSFVHLIMSVNLNISNTAFVNGYSQSGGAIYLSGFSTINILSSVFKNNYAKNGGALYLTTFHKVMISRNSEFSNNTADYTGGDIYAFSS